MWRKIFLVVMVCLLMSPMGWAYKKISCEPENDNTVSYVIGDAVSSSGATHHLLFVKRVNSDGEEEYWVRQRVNTDKDRFLYNSSFVIDGIEYQIRAITDMKHYYTQTGLTVREDLLGEYFVEYYIVPQDIIEKLGKTDNDVYVIMNRWREQNLKFKLRDRFKGDIQTVISLSYEDKDNYWKPNVRK